MPNITNLETQRSAQNTLELEAYFGIAGSSKPMKKVFKLPWPDRVPIMIDSMIGGLTLLADFHLTKRRWYSIIEFKNIRLKWRKAPLVS